MTGLTLVALAVGIAGNVLSRTAVLDAIALWPLAALVVPAALIGLKGGRHRALAPLVLLTWMLVTVGLHLGGVAGLPSGAAAELKAVRRPWYGLSVFRRFIPSRRRVGEYGN